jgi:tetratricopeptide (TPR) repeat protein
MSEFFESLLGKSAMDKLQEIDRRGSRFTQFLRDNRGDDAISELLGIFQYQPDWTQLHFEIVDYAVKRERLAKPLYEPLYQMIQKKPKDAQLRYMMGLLMQALGDQRAAIAEYEEATRLDPSHAVAWHNLAVAHSSTDPAKSIELWQTATRLNPRLAEAHFALGAILMRVGKRREAVESFRKFVPLAYPHLEAFRQQALLEIKRFG